MRSFIKWAGGKYQLLSYITNMLPSKFNTYFEPFVGGGSIFFNLKNDHKITTSNINDMNTDLMLTYIAIWTQPDQLVQELDSGYYINNKERFYEIRNSYPVDAISIAARFIYLNKTSFNGLYRVNSKNRFNVPFGNYNNPKILDETNIRLCSSLLQDTTMTNEPYDFIIDSIKKNDFVYFDPPYLPISDTSAFTSYTKSNFTIDDQIKLSNVFKYLDDQGVHIMLSNSKTSKIEEMYKEFNQITVPAKRSINCKGNKRGYVDELIITNYPISTPHRHD